MPVLEVIACSLEDAVSAERGGAGRLEIVRNLDLGGLTPIVSLIREIQAAVSIPVRVMLRENAGYGVSGEDEIERLICAAREFAGLRVDGFVLGFLCAGNLDLPLAQRILQHAPAVKATFHRAFEELPDPRAAITALKTIPQIDRILTSGSAGHLDRLIHLAAPEIQILAGGGLDRQAIQALHKTTAVHEFHVGRAARRNSDIHQPVDAKRVRALVELIAG